jgi:hypothetical protein
VEAQGGVLVLDRADGHTRLAWDGRKGFPELFFDDGKVTIDDHRRRCVERVAGGGFLIECQSGKIKVFEAEATAGGASVKLQGVVLD